jgi:NAD(P)H-hydrate repair Nnr-like enzyme with NAD(P)H-hydrate dehydratase domain
LAGKEATRRAEREVPREITEEWAISVLPRREPGAHKWGVGGLVIVAGSPAYAGAAALCCIAAGRSGAGIVAAALPRSIARVLVGLVPDATLIILPEGDSSSVALRASQAIAERFEEARAMVIGPGLGRDSAAAVLLAALFGFTRTRGSIGFGTSGANAAGVRADGIIAQSGKPVVVDADALNWLAEQELWWERLATTSLVLTPHPGEMARLLAVDVDAVVASPADVARDAAKLWKQTVVLKGSPTVIAAPDGAVSTMEPPPALATAGSGDVLSGSIGAFLAQGLPPCDAAALAVYAGCRAGERVAAKYSTLGVVASDLPTAIAEELGVLERGGT